MDVIIYNLRGYVYKIYLKENDMLKALIVATIVLFSTIAFGSSLVCDPQDNVVKYDMEVDGIIYRDFDADPDGAAWIPVDTWGDGLMHVFRLRAIDASGWAGDWSDPFDARKPAKSGNARIIN